MKSEIWHRNANGKKVHNNSSSSSNDVDELKTKINSSSSSVSNHVTHHWHSVCPCLCVCMEMCDECMQFGYKIQWLRRKLEHRHISRQCFVFVPFMRSIRLACTLSLSFSVSVCLSVLVWEHAFDEGLFSLLLFSDSLEFLLCCMV